MEDRIAERPVTVLYIDDDPDSREIMTVFLKLSDIEVTGVADGAAGLERAVFVNFDLFLIGTLPEGFDLIEMCRKLRAIHRHTPIFCYGSRWDRTTRENCRGAGADEFIEKPDLDQLIVMLGRYGLLSADAAKEVDGVYSN
jgi:DNA-binding response OmpR family regulator